MSRENRNLAVMLEPSSVFHYWFPIFKRSLNTCPIFRGHLRGPAGHVTRARVIWSRAHDGFPDRTIGETTSPHYINYPTVAELTNTDTAQRSKSGAIRVVHAAAHRGPSVAEHDRHEIAAG